MSKRHSDKLSEDEIQAKLAKQIPPNTLSHSKWAMRVFNDWRRERINATITDEDQLNVYNEPEEMSKSDLNFLLKYFVHEVRNQKGEKYPRDSLKQLLCGIQYFFRHV